MDPSRWRPAVLRAAAVVGALILGAACARAAAPLPATLPAGGRLLEPGAGSFAVAERYRGQVLVLDFWAGWCDDCVRAIPQVNRLAADLAPDGVAVLGVNVGEAPADAARAAVTLGIQYPIALDPELELAGALGATALPALLVIDRAGVIVHRGREVDAAARAAIGAAIAR